ncbi:MAG: hypothetical protein OEY87_05450 [Gammaproteobacteria bacterium]|nr:hypothetical protein [Gammaproteobacteria bacterium]
MKLPVLIGLLFYCSTAVANHSFGGLDMCALYPEIMPPGITKNQLPDPNGSGAALMENYCTQCHALPGPGRHTADEWPQVFNHMLTLMDVANKFGGLLGHVKTPDNIERQQLINYLQRYALRGLKQKPQGYGATAFENHCNACHQLPDPAYYSAQQWPDIIKRMQHHMTVMQYSAPSIDAMMQIQLFLQQYNNKNVIDKDILNSSLTDNTPHTVNDARKYFISAESLLALGPFLLLISIGLTRWWLNQHKHKNNHL